MRQRSMMVLARPTTQSQRAAQLDCKAGPSTQIHHPPLESMGGPSGKSSLGHHHLHELFVVDLPIAIDVCLTDHLIDLLIRELLAEVRHHVAQLGGTDEATAIAVKDLESLD